MTKSLLTRRRYRAGGYPWPVLVLVILCGPGNVTAGHLEEVLVTESHVEHERYIDLGGNAIGATAADASSLMNSVPGGARNFNGPLSGQLQYRGLSGPRMNVLVDGLPISPGGPNWMDPPLHYLPLSLTDEFRVVRGIAPVSAGAGIGGQVAATIKKIDFGKEASFKPAGDLTIKGHTADDGYNAGGILGVANTRHRLQVLFSRDNGADAEFDDGDIDATRYERDFYGIGYGIRLGGHEFAFDYHHIDTNDSGTPTLPMDIAFLDTDLFSLSYAAHWGTVAIDAKLSYSDIDHGMSNYSLRPAPNFSTLPLPPFLGTDRRNVHANSETLGYAFVASYPVHTGKISVGFDGRLEDHAATVGDPDVPTFFIENFNDADTDRYSFFAEWRGPLTARLNVEAGVRYNRVETSARTVDAQPAQMADAMPMMCSAGTMPMPPPCAVRILRDRFNGGDRKQHDDNLDAVVVLDYQWRVGLSTSLSFGRKTRSPSYIERYLWIPLEVNSGLGDGNNYIGDVSLDPEVSYEVEGGLDWRTADYYLTPRVFYRRIDDFIQGTAVPASPVTMPVIGVSGRANGDPTPLQFTNVDAEIYGFDTGFGARLTDRLYLDGNLSYVRGKRRDIDDNLYRIAPPSLHTTLSYRRDRWSVSIGSVAVARQDHISQTITNDPTNRNNSNAETPGYVIFNLAGSYQLPFADSRIIAGVENVGDNGYIDHLSGFNRVLLSDVARGQRLPGLGRNGYVALNIGF